MAGHELHELEVMPGMVAVAMDDGEAGDGSLLSGYSEVVQRRVGAGDDFFQGFDAGNVTGRGEM
jgi:hypothetical protein